MFRMLLLFSFCVTLLVTSEGYIHMNAPCPADEQCPGHPDAVCTLDCLKLDAAGEGIDCVYHFYDANNKLLDCFM